MKDLIKNFIDRFFFTQETVYFALLIFITAVCLILFGNILLPILISLVIAFLLNGLVVSLESFRLSRWLSLALSLIIFFGLYASMILILPSIVSQINSLLQTLPNIFTTFQENLSSLTQSYPDIFSEEEVRSLLANLSSQINTLL